ncbi:hypothetical protein [Kitasatospora sp. NPDC090091]|uniref:hypothetical protein n=1 Tax=Kitasatospora sp. NPDC090091 TaxID=3364081 RepID=UPI0038075347
MAGPMGPVDPCGMVLGDAPALDSFVGLNGESVDGLADVTYWGRHAGDAHTHLGGERTFQYGGQRPYGRPAPLAIALGDSPAGLAAWMVEKLESWLRLAQEVRGDRTAPLDEPRGARPGVPAERHKRVRGWRFLAYADQ